MSHHRIFYRRNLPHYQPPGATLFITTRLAGSLPKQVVEQLIAEAEQLAMLRSAIEPENDQARRAYLDQRHLFTRWDAALDAAASGPTWLNDANVAALVAEALHHRDGGVFRLDAFCIMFNHLHLVCKPLERAPDQHDPLHKTMQQFKSYTAVQANRLLGRTGAFWHRESYDHALRDGGEQGLAIRYTLNNPVKAGLAAHWHDWPWSYCREEWLHAAPQHK